MTPTSGTFVPEDSIVVNNGPLMMQTDNSAISPIAEEHGSPAQRGITPTNEVVDGSAWHPAGAQSASLTKPEASSSFSKRGLISREDFYRYLGVSRATFYRLQAAGKIGPRPIRLSSGSVRFDGDEVDAWLSNRRPDGGLHDADNWPSVWERLRKKRT